MRKLKPTYRHARLDIEEVIDLTLSSSLLESRIKDWHVSDEPSLSDHRQIFFNMDADRTTQVPRASQGRETGSALKSFWVTPKAVSKEVSKACCPVVHRKVK
jgi:hypothetical protein